VGAKALAEGLKVKKVARVCNTSLLMSGFLRQMNVSRNSELKYF
jgi:hypothetical protein